MASSFSNVQVYTAGRPADAARADLLQAIRRRLLGDGRFEEVPADANADVRIAVAPSGTRPWIAVYAEATESGEPEALARAAAEFSEDAGMPAVGILGDGDGLTLVLCASGRCADVYYSDTDAADDSADDGVPSALAGQPAEWSRLFTHVPGHEFARSVADAERLGESAVPRRLADLLKWDPALCTLGFDTLAGAKIEGLTRLAFRYCEKAAAVRPAALDVSLTPPARRPHAGGPFEASIHVTSLGGRSTGLDVAFWGPAIDSGLLRVDSVRLGAGGAAQTADVQPTNTDDSQRLLVAEFPDAAIPAEGRPGAGEAEEGIEIALRGLIQRAGREELLIGVAPRANPEGGQGASLVIDAGGAPAAKPMHASSDESCALSIEALQSPEVLFGFVVFGDDATGRSAALADGFRRWHGLLAGGAAATWRLGSARHDRRNKPRQFNCRPGGDPPAGLMEHFDSCCVLSIQKLGGEDGMDYADAGARESRKSDEPDEAPHAVFRVRLDGEGSPTHAAAEELLASVLDDLAGRCDVVQAFVGCWGVAPAIRGNLYEQACDVGSTVVASRQWARQHVRAVTPTMWLGPALLGQLPSQVGLERVADVHPIGRCKRLRLRRGATLGELENVLEALLPTPDQESRVQGSLSGGD
ncbi:MAG: hypothetical protein BIFFINMI_00372 [Phycisphaerae bacterium]|nr:hypothetical protein [Phycisphaerae bacterium]